MRLFTLLCLLPFVGFSQTFDGQPLVTTYSIVAYDEASDQIGVAVQSHWFSVGSIVTWAEAGVGAIATQSLVNPQFGPDGLQLLSEGVTAEEVVTKLVSADEGRAYRQLGVVSASGEVSNYTGESCIADAGGYIGDGFAVQANLMLNDSVWQKMAEAYKSSMDLPLAERMLAALQAAQDVGGDSRGKQSAAMLIVNGKKTGEVMKDKILDLRIEDHENPIEEMTRLVTVFRAYEHMNYADVLLEEGHFEKAIAEYEAARKLQPGNDEIYFWQAVALANTGQLDKALPLFKKVYEVNQNWRKVVTDIYDAGFLSVEKKELNKILK